MEGEGGERGCSRRRKIEEKERGRSWGGGRLKQLGKGAWGSVAEVPLAGKNGEKGMGRRRRERDKGEKEGAGEVAKMGL